VREREKIREEDMKAIKCAFLYDKLTRENKKGGKEEQRAKDDPALCK